jgi:hypothetical protein
MHVGQTDRLSEAARSLLSTADTIIEFGLVYVVLSFLIQDFVLGRYIQVPEF